MVNQTSIVVLALLLLLLFEFTVEQRLSSSTELTALFELRSSLGIRRKDWPRKFDPCSSWNGVRCENGRVSGINIAGFRRTRLGEQNPRFAVGSLANFTGLVSFNASRFLLPGSIPDWFGQRLLALQVLDLRSCNITGVLPLSIGNLSSLTSLYLSDNRLSGEIPSSFGRLLSLSVLDLSKNSLTGSIPQGIGALSWLRTLNLSSNGLTSSIPAQLGGLDGLIDLDLSNNGLSGLLPANLFRASRMLQVIVLRNNSFIGEVPDVIWSISGLNMLDISRNNFTARLPNAYSNDSNAVVAVLDISGNKFYGGLTTIVRRFSSVNLSGNYFEGKVPDYVSDNAASLSTNCLQNVSSQRTLTDCVSFYAERGLSFDNFGSTNSSEPPAPERRNSDGSSNRNRIILAAVLGGAGFIVLLTSLLLLVRFLRRRKKVNHRGIGIGQVPLEAGSPSPGLASNFSSLADMFTYQQLLQATADFTDANLIKHGHSGDLFKGVLESGLPVVVKRIDSRSIKKEVYLLELDFFSKVAHTRVVPLLGHCFEKENEKLLVYKYMPNGDLSSSLYRKNNSEGDGLKSLDWITRLKIAIGAAEGLSYLHHECTPPLVRKHQVSLRGASAREISRDALLEKVSLEREHRNYARKAASASIYIQKVWRSYNETRKVAIKFQDDWESLVKNPAEFMTGELISCSVLRPFIFFITCLSIRPQKILARELKCMQTCFGIILESINSTDSKKNICSLIVDTAEQRRTSMYQMQKLISLCSFILSECDTSPAGSRDIVVLTSLGLRLVVVLTDLKSWKIVNDDNIKEADAAVKNLVSFMGNCRSGLYASLRRYISRLDVCFSPKGKSIVQTDDKFLISASAVTIAIRPFSLTTFNMVDCSKFEVHSAAEQYCLYLLTIPWLTQRLPAVLLPALKHKSTLSPCLQLLLISKDEIVRKMSDIDQSSMDCSLNVVPPVGWALVNIIALTAGSENDFLHSGALNQGLQYASYAHVVIILADNLLAWLHNTGWNEKGNQNLEGNDEPYEPSVSMQENKTASVSLKTSFIDLFRPVSQQWHLKKLLEISKAYAHTYETKILPPNNLESLENLRLLDIAYFYSYMLRIFAAFNPMIGPLPLLNMLSFTPGFLGNLWGVLESSIFHGNRHTFGDASHSRSKVSGKKKQVIDKKLKQASNDGVSKWANVLQKLTGKSQVEVDFSDPADDDQVDEDAVDIWDVESLRHGPQGISKDMFCLLHLFCATYSHLLLVLDDIEFYEKQVPFTLEQQRRIASVLNTLVYNGLSYSVGQQNASLMDSAIRCLHLIYERDCRHQFCPPALWLSPARRSRPPIAVAARTHEVLSANIRTEDAVVGHSMGSVITSMPYVFPFQERVQMFREFISMDKVSRKMAGEISGPGSRSIEIVIRRGHIVEDGFRQLNSLGSRLKSSIHVSFVSECGLPEAGLDYGGLSKEFLTDISKAAFAPEYGLFSQTSTSDRLLIPNAAARFLENGIQMIEFLGRVVGKALYEGILLDYSFSHVFVQKLLGRYSFLDELSTLDPELYRNLMYVKHYDGDVEELCLDFTVTEESFGKRHVIELKPGGKDVCVTNANKMQYVHAMADYKLNRQILPFSNAFYRGLTDLISPSWLKLFNASEFNQLLSGGDHDIDVDDLRNNTRYTGGYSEGSRTVKLFWEVMNDFEPKERCMLLKFVTSCSRAPLLGFKYLQPSFTIHKVASDTPLWAAIGGSDVERLPSASTCYNTLKLPTYKRSSTLKAKLRYAINSNAGFELS